MTSDEKIRELIKNRMEDVSASSRVTSCQVWLTVRDLMSTNVATVGSDQTMALAANLMADDGISSLVVVDDGVVVGIITEKDFLEKVVAKKMSAMDVKVKEVMSSPVISVSPALTVLEAGIVAEERHVKRLPVIDEGKLVGIVTQTDLIRVLTSYGMWRDITEIMTKEVATIQRVASVAEAASIMASRGISGIVVMQDKKIVGILTERDLLKRVIAPGRDPSSVTTGEVMSTPAMTIPTHFSVFGASRVMEKMHVRRLVVEDNRWLCGVVTQTDIFRAVEDKWREEEEKNLKALEESDTCIYTLDLDGRITYINAAFMRLLEVEDKSQLVGKPFLPDELWFDKREREQFARELNKETVVISDLTLKTTGGKRIDVTIYSSPTKNIHSQVDGRQGVVNDITAKKELVTLKEAQKALATSEERYRRISEAVTDYMYSVRFEPGRHAEPVHSAASAAITGWTPEEFKANPTLWLDMVYPEDLEAVREQVSRCICGRGFGPIEHRIVRKDGNVRWIRRTLVPNYNSEGKLTSYDGLLQDITDLKISEQVQMQLTSELEQAMEELRDLAYIATQDKKGAKKGTGETGDGKEHIMKVLLGRIKGMQNLIEGLLYCSQGFNREKKADVDLNEMVSEIIADVAGTGDIDVVVESKLPVIVCRKKGIRHVFHNLISNAVNYTDKSNGRVTMSWSDDGDCWKFSVNDKGPAIEEKTFCRCLKSQKGHSPQGTGEDTTLGLMIAKKIIELEGGVLWGHSAAEEGNTFYFVWSKEKEQEQFNAINSAATAGLGVQ